VQIKGVFGPALPDYSEARWLQFARASYVEDENGEPRMAADPRIGDMLRAVPAGAAPGLWLAFAALWSVPTLALRGEHSDLLSAATFDRMQLHKPDLIRVTVPNRGHPPQLDERESVEAVERLLEGIGE
jgi:pimeloyl-ACP methyl ester carboxylesterase